MKKLKFIALLCGIAALTATFDSCDKEEEKSSAKQITSFVIQGTPNVTATINETTKTIAAVVPEGTNLTALTVSIGVSDKATVVPASGSVINFTTPIPFTVTAEDGSTTVYTATVNAGGSSIATELTNTMINDGNKTLAVGTYLIKTDLTLNANKTLTVLPGTTFRFLQGKSISISSGATLIAVGTEGAGRILFTSDRSPQMPGDWKHLKFDKSDGCKLEYCVFEYGGGLDHTQYGMLTISDCHVLVRNCTFRHSKYTGLHVGSSSSVLEQFTGNTFTDCGENQADAYPIRVSYAVNLKEMGPNTINTTKGLYVLSPDVNETMTLKKLNNNVPYLFKAGLDVTGSTSVTLTIEPGTIMQFANGRKLEVRGNGRLVAKGTPSEKIIFTGMEKSNGYWIGISFVDGTTTLLTGNEMEYCEVSYGGKLSSSREGNISCADTDADEVSIKNCHIAHSSGWGIWRSSGAIVTTEGNTFEDNTKGDVKP